MMNGEVRTMPITFFVISNRVEHQKLNQVTGWVFGVQLGLRQTQALINTYHIILIHRHRHVIHHLSIHWKVIQLAASWITFQWIDGWWMTWNEYDVIGINQCLCLPKAELNTKNSTRWEPPQPGWVFGVELGLRQTQALIKSKIYEDEKCHLLYYNFVENITTL